MEEALTPVCHGLCVVPSHIANLFRQHFRIVGYFVSQQGDGRQESAWKNITLNEINMIAVKVHTLIRDGDGL